MSHQRPLPLLLAAAFTAGCGPSILSQFEEAKLEALADPGPVPATWSADAELGLSWELVSSLVVHELQQRIAEADEPLRIELPLGAEVVLEPELELGETSIGPARACEACVKVDAAFDGQIGWSLRQLEGSIPVDLVVQAVLEMTTLQQGAAATVHAELRRATVQLPESLELERLKIDLNDPLAVWLQERIERQFPSIPVAEIGADEVPIRALRLQSGDEHLKVQVLTRSPVRAPGGVKPSPGGDWYLSIDERALAGIARREAFEAGELDFEVHADPRSLEVDQQAFTLGLRLWRLAGAGWWRDYQVQGRLSIEGDRIELQAEEVRELEHSRGAALVDPLALLAKGYILDAIEEALQVARPAEISESVGGARLVLGVEQAQGGQGALTLLGTAELQERASKKNKKQRGGGQGSGRKGGKKGRR
jgi:hypothetical protein